MGDWASHCVVTVPTCLLLVIDVRSLHQPGGIGRTVCTDCRIFCMITSESQSRQGSPPIADTAKQSNSQHALLFAPIAVVPLRPDGTVTSSLVTSLQDWPCFFKKISRSLRSN